MYHMATSLSNEMGGSEISKRLKGDKKMIGNIDKNIVYHNHHLQSPQQ